MKRILFLGLGHLGQFFIEQNTSHEIWGSKRNVDVDSKTKLIPFSLGEKWIGPKDFDVIIISFPPTENYAQKLSTLLSELAPLKKVIFISSTSVFGSGHINEKSTKAGETKNAHELIKCEELIAKLPGFIIVRPGGLIDSTRHPKNFAKRMPKLSKSQTNVNLVHTADVAAFLHYCIEKDLAGEDYNLVCDDHPTKAEFYLGFNPQLQIDTSESELRIIDNVKSKSTGFTYKFCTLDWC